MRPRPRTALPALAAALAGALTAAAAEFGSAGDVLAFARSRLPREPMRVEGTLRAKAPNHFTRATYKVDWLLNWGEREACCAVLDERGRYLGQLRAEYPRDASPRYTFRPRPEADPVSAPDLLEPIGKTDVSWSDLTLAFLWWREGTYQGKVMKRGREAALVEFAAPDPDDEVQTVRVWIDSHLGLLLQVNYYDRNEKLLRSLRISTIKKIRDDLWIVKNLDMIRPLSGARTKFTVEDVTFPSSPSRGGTRH
ncbi:outer membrane lipoprotein-sorting protein [Kiritimatiella glycovorans]|uniref:Uncharacterized protein TP-0789 domain-containing protein n=1 Tax=Kiritimatiella glycovorans TaxID=1307763 RepID=A0A0G3EKE4_9BACT|nr:outer membrane lipoprotein-sorting protein [Kiritimatiella glycovorans]AKJ65290.1 hypothetical protein L21SP4_02057 [Kiritimatiella glycovorans]